MMGDIHDDSNKISFPYLPVNISFNGNIKFQKQRIGTPKSWQANFSN